MYTHHQHRLRGEFLAGIVAAALGVDSAYSSGLNENRFCLGVALLLIRLLDCSLCDTLDWTDKFICGIIARGAKSLSGHI